MSETVVPWVHLEKATVPSLRKWADLFDAVRAPMDTTPAFGATGPLIAAELRAVADYKEGKAQKKQRKAVKSAEESAEHQWEVEFIEHFSELCKEHTGVGFTGNWGTTRRQLRKFAETSHEDVERMKEMAEEFFRRKEERFIFRDGNIASFLRAYVQLSADRQTGSRPAYRTPRLS